MNFIKLYFLFSVFSLKAIVLSLPLNEDETAANGECDPLNKLLGKDESYNCCLEDGITCNNGHITRM